MPFDSSYQTPQPVPFTTMADLGKKYADIDQSRASAANIAANTELTQQQTQNATLENQIKQQQLHDAAVINAKAHGLPLPGSGPGAPSAPNPNQPYSPTNPRQLIDRTGTQGAAAAASPDAASAPASGAPLTAADLANAGAQQGAPAAGSQPPTSTGQPAQNLPPLPAVVEDAWQKGEIHLSTYQDMRKALQKFDADQAEIDAKKAATAKTQQELQQARDNQLANALRGLQATHDPLDPSGERYNPTVVAGILSGFHAQNSDWARQIEQLDSELKQHPDQLNQILNRHVQMADAATQNSWAEQQRRQTEAEKEANEAPGQIADSAQKQRASAAAQLAAAPNAAVYTRAYDALAPALRKQFPPPEQFDPAKTPAQARAIGMTAEQQTQAAQNAKPKTAIEYAAIAADPNASPEDRAKATQALRINAQNSPAAARINVNAGGLTDDDFQRAGEQYARTGVMPQLGQGSAAARARILHEAGNFERAQGLNPGDVAAKQAAFNGDRKSLEKFQANRDQIVSFEQTAQKNIDQFLDLASKIPDTGSPWINAPLRAVDQKMAGSANMAAVNAARAVATNEIAKVTSGGGMSGVLSDAARQEVKDYNPQTATFKQTLAVVKVLKQDMANRHAAMDSTLDDIKSRLGGQQPGGSSAAAPKVGEVVNIGGKRVKITAIHSNGKFDGDEVN